LAVVIGIVSITWPSFAVGAFVIFFAVYVFASAAMDAFQAVNSDTISPVFGHLFLSVVAVAAGVTSLAWPGITALTLVTFVGPWSVMASVVEFGLTFRTGEGTGDRAMWLLGGIVSVAALGVVLFIRPGIGAEFLAIVFGLYSIAFGISAPVVPARERSRLAYLPKHVSAPPATSLS
jgi:uncharacterized membrane protein HdeD (DUF308 family)